MKTLCILDFDDTLFDTHRLFHVELAAVFVEQGIDETVWREAYRAVRPTGYTIEKHLAAIVATSPSKIDASAIHRAIMNSLGDLRRFVFPDVLPFIAKVKEAGVTLEIISFGNPEWQGFKVKHSGLAELVDRAVYLEGEGKKETALLDMDRYDQVIMVDDKATELDAVKTAHPKLVTYHIVRAGLERPASARYAHIACQNLDEVNLS